ncbi:DUF11 domain-containing protein [Streptomyces sp. L2]|uniref:DUF11 domain-containing protein n=1 Tax=Streptomyces sp. L2 TaxID=2162665 RepID=UPI0010135754|nr:DUF11 domain-containing protein [Streptomyces sp. L2]
MRKQLPSHLLRIALMIGGTAGGVLGLLQAPEAAAADVNADLSLTKAGPFTSDGQSHWTITVKNNGPDASAGWTVRDPMNGVADTQAPGNLNSTDPRCKIEATLSHGGQYQKALTCTGGPLAAGASTTIDVTGDPFSGTLNWAIVAGNDPDGNTSNNSAYAVPVEAVPVVNSGVAMGAASFALTVVAAASLIRRRTAA